MADTIFSAVGPLQVPRKDPKLVALRDKLKAAHAAHHKLRDTSVAGPTPQHARLWVDGAPNQNPAYDKGPEKDAYEAALKEYQGYLATKKKS